MHKYEKISASQVPTGVRFDVPARNGGQIVEIAYGGFDRAPHDDGDLFKRIRDRSVGPNAYEYYRLAKAT